MAEIDVKGFTVDGKKIKRIEIDRDTCIGAASCAALAPEAFQLDDENIAIITDPVSDDAQTILLAAQSCPVDAISLYDEHGNKLWPEA
ncbi:ferredoxin [Candidatus Berkelbacteria bacterium]|nr:ferredoxin [Candidatus Berkelbacteria bacterium]